MEDLQKRYRQLRKKGRQKRAAARNAFDLDRIAVEMESLASQELNSRIDLPPFSRIQRMQVICAGQEPSRKPHSTCSDSRTHMPIKNGCCCIPDRKSGMSEMLSTQTGHI